MGLQHSARVEVTESGVKQWSLTILTILTCLENNAWEILECHNFWTVMPFFFSAVICVPCNTQCALFKAKFATADNVRKTVSLMCCQNLHLISSIITAWLQHRNKPMYSSSYQSIMTFLNFFLTTNSKNKCFTLLLWPHWWSSFHFFPLFRYKLNFQSCTICLSEL